MRTKWFVYSFSKIEVFLYKAGVKYQSTCCVMLFHFVWAIDKTSQKPTYGQVYVMFCRSHLSLPIRVFKRCHNGGGNENVRKAIGWIGKTTTLHVQHAFLYTSLPSRHDYDLKNAQFHEIFSLFVNLDWLEGIPLQNSSVAFDKVSELE